MCDKRDIKGKLLLSANRKSCNYAASIGTIQMTLRDLENG